MDLKIGVGAARRVDISRFCGQDERTESMNKRDFVCARRVVPLAVSSTLIACMRHSAFH